MTMQYKDFLIYWLNKYLDIGQVVINRNKRPGGEFTLKNTQYFKARAHLRLSSLIVKVQSVLNVVFNE